MSEIAMLAFEPSNVGQLDVQSQLIEEYGPSALPDMPIWINSAGNVMYDPTRCREIMRMPDQDFATYLQALRNARLLPLNALFVRSMQLTLGYCEAEAQQRIQRARQRERSLRVYGESIWRDADLLAEVEAVTGPLQRRGREWWACCPFHEERTASFHVDPERRLWKCFSCGRGGGVIDWRRAMEAAA